MQNLLGHNAAWRGGGLEVRLPLIRLSPLELQGGLRYRRRLSVQRL